MIKEQEKNKIESSSFDGNKRNKAINTALVWENSKKGWIKQKAPMPIMEKFRKDSGIVSDNCKNLCVSNESGIHIRRTQFNRSFWKTLCVDKSGWCFHWILQYRKSSLAW